MMFFFFFFQAEDGIRDLTVTGVQTCALPIYTGEPNLDDYLKANEASKVKLDHLVKPAVERGLNPYHYLLVRVDGDRLDMQVIAVDWGEGFRPYTSNSVELKDRSEERRVGKEC